MKKLALALVAFVAFALPAAAQADPDHQHGGASTQRIDWD